MSIPKTFPAPRLNTRFTREESHDLWMLNYLYPKGDVPGDPRGWPDWSDADCWAPSSADRPGPSPSSWKSIDGPPSETDYPF